MNPCQKINPDKQALRAGAVLCAFLNLAAQGAPATIDTTVNPANGHTYYLLESSNWTDAENAAVALGGHLATINDLAENNWIWNRWGTNRSLWIGLYAPVAFPNFEWASGEPVIFMNWRAGEPNGDRYTYMYAKNQGSIGGKWNDTPATLINPGGTEPPLYGVVEAPFCTPHAAKATAMIVNGFVVGAQVTDGGCGYTNAPMVSFEGGGGSNAMATAVMTDSRVSQILITDAGCCYTNAPKIVIASPPMVPIVRIGVSKVKVTQDNLVPGWKYVLESSHDFVHWTPTGPEFVAQSQTIMGEFDVEETGKYFRLRVVP